MQQVLHDKVGLITLGALAALDVATIDATRIDGGHLQGMRIKRFKFGMEISGKTDGEGPILVGAAVGLTAAEIEEALEADPQGSNDTDARDKANRKVFPLMMIPRINIIPSGPVPLIDVPWPFKTIPEGVGLVIWAYNMSSGALTTGTTIQTWMTFVTEWLRD